MAGGRVPLLLAGFLAAVVVAWTVGGLFAQSVTTPVTPEAMYGKQLDARWGATWATLVGHEKGTS